MKAYELLFFVAPNTDEETRAGVMKRIDVAITAEGGVVDSVEDWGKRKLAFEIDNLTEGDCASTTLSSATWSCAVPTGTKHGSAGPAPARER